MPIVSFSSLFSLFHCLVILVVVDSEGEAEYPN